MGLDSINDIFRKDHNNKYTNRIAELAQKILSYVLVNQDLKSSIVYSKPFYDKDFAGDGYYIITKYSSIVISTDHIIK